MKKIILIFIFNSLGFFVFCQQSLIGRYIETKTVNIITYNLEANRMLYIAPSDCDGSESFTFLNGIGYYKAIDGSDLKFFWKEYEPIEQFSDIIMIKIPSLNDDDAAVFNKLSYRLLFEDGQEKYLFVSFYHGEPIVVYLQYSHESYLYYETKYIVDNQDAR